MQGGAHCPHEGAREVSYKLQREKEWRAAMYCPKCGRWIDQHEGRHEAREQGTCEDAEKCSAREEDPHYPDYYSDGVVIRGGE